MPTHDIHRGGDWGNVFWLTCDDVKFAEKHFNIDEMREDYNITRIWAQEEMQKHVATCNPRLIHDHDKLVQTLVYHQQTNTSGCHCGWNVLGASWAEHVVDVYEQVLKEG